MDSIFYCISKSGSFFRSNTLGHRTQSPVSKKGSLKKMEDRRRYLILRPFFLSPLHPGPFLLFLIVWAFGRSCWCQEFSAIKEGSNNWRLESGRLPSAVAWCQFSDDVQTTGIPFKILSFPCFGWSFFRLNFEILKGWVQFAGEGNSEYEDNLQAFGVGFLVIFFSIFKYYLIYILIWYHHLNIIQFSS